MKKIYIITVVALFLSVSLYSQREQLSLSINGGYSYTLLKNDIPQSISKEGKGYVGNIQFNTAISHFFAIGLGVGYAKYSSEVSLDKYFKTVAATDTEGDSFEYRLYGTNLKEIQSVDIIEIPLVLILQNQEHKKFKTYLQLGAKAQLPLQSHFQSTSGTIETRGYYPQYNVELSNMPNHGFDIYSLTGVSGNLSTKVGYAALMEFGANISLDKSYLSIALFCSYGLSSIIQQRDIFTSDHAYQSFSSIASDVIPYSVGIKVGFVFPFRPLK